MKLLALLPMVLTAGCAAETGLVGKVVPPYPSGVSSQNGSCVTVASRCDHAIGVLEGAGRVPIWLAALRAEGLNADGKPLWRVTDEIRIPNIGPNEHLESCVNPRAEINGAYAILSNARQGEWHQARWVVRLDGRSGKFRHLDPAGVRCAIVGED
jgi:hypothetical protein